MRGDREKASLNRVKRYLFCHKEKQLNLLMSNCNYEINDDDVLDNIRDYIMARRESYQGMVFGNIKEIFVALLNAKSNPEPNKFPDFLLDNGFIEHFQVTSSIENKSGSKKAEFEATFKREIKSEQEEFRKRCEENAVPGQSDSISWRRNDVKHSYENFQKSLATNIKNHLESLDKFEGEKKLKIFLIEYSDFGLEMMEKLPDNLLFLGVQPEHLWKYRLSKDKKILKYLYEFKDKIDYIIFEDNEDCEILKLSNIPNIISNIKYYFQIIGRYNLIVRRQDYVCVGMNLNGEKNEQN
ncbi:MAG: hypothetical protein IJ538_02665 [Clostridia bacterium]|nr:hypothetical protein [Clostridia bacterium]